MTQVVSVGTGASQGNFMMVQLPLPGLGRQLGASCHPSPVVNELNADFHLISNFLNISSHIELAAATLDSYDTEKSIANHLYPGEASKKSDNRLTKPDSPQLAFLSSLGFS